jgi:acyl-CoA thioesterase FadM
MSQDLFTYEHEVRVTYCLTNAEGNVDHDQYARLFAVTRELFGLDFIPRFKEEAGLLYLLKTRNASYEYRKDFVFGDVMKIRLWMKELTYASFALAAEFVNSLTDKVHATGQQQIVYTDLKGKPRRIPEDLRKLIAGAMKPAKDMNE